MEPDLANEAVETMQAPPVAGAGSEKEREKMEVLAWMAGTEVEPDSISREDVEPLPTEVEAPVNEEERAAERKQARELVAREFPEAVAEGTELYEACREELAYLREANSPLASDPQAEYKIARRMARVLGYGQRAAVAPAKTTAQPQRRSVRPMPTGGAPVEPPAMTLERRVSGAKSTGDMLELMREIGTPFEALLKRG